MLHRNAITKHDLVVKCIKQKHDENAMFYTEIKNVVYRVLSGVEVKDESYKSTNYYCSEKLFWRMWHAIRDSNLPIMLVRGRESVKDKTTRRMGYKDTCSIRLMNTVEFKKYGSAKNVYLNQRRIFSQRDC